MPLAFMQEDFLVFHEIESGDFILFVHTVEFKHCFLLTIKSG